MDKESLIRKWLNNELTDKEKKNFDELEDSDFNKKILETASHFKASHFSDVDNFGGLRNKIPTKKPIVNRLSWTKTILRIAAVAIITLAVYHFAFNKETVTLIETIANEKTEVALPDNSKVILNGLSSVMFDKDDWRNQRLVNLEGEAFFNVENGTSFNVITSIGTVTVVGTQFNVEQRENLFEVKCFEGSVKVSTNLKEKILYAGDVLKIEEGKLIEDKVVLNEPKWIHNRSVFKQAPYNLVIKELELEYNIKVTFKNVNLDRKFSGGFIHNDLNDALISITKPMGLTFEIGTLNEVVIHDKTN